MSNEEIKEKLLDFCFDLFKDSGVERDIIEYVDFTDDLGMDSVTFMSMLIGVESCFDIIIPDEMLLMEYFRDFDKTFNVVRSIISGEIGGNGQ